MPNQQFQQFIHALEWKAVPALIVCAVGAALLGFALKWSRIDWCEWCERRSSGRKRKPKKRAPIEGALIGYSLMGMRRNLGSFVAEMVLTRV